MQWPRDADRLPNGNTLIADSNSGRILEINQSGDVVWETTVALNYDVERLGTGDESQDGESAASLNLSSASEGDAPVTTGSPIVSIKQAVDKRSADILSILPSKIENGIQFSTPGWMGSAGTIAVGVNLISVVSFGLIRIYHSKYTIQLPVNKR